ncbi:MAG: membrane dipeptidase [Candidatus Aminicenantes bacterium]|nr:membrane dipeptidase [Candidatus Aminicenantes bacterium]
MKRRAFFKMAGVAALGSTTLSGFPQQKSDAKEAHYNEKGIHPVLEKAPPYLFIDSCMQIWPDAEFDKAHKHGVSAYTVTAWDPHLPVDQALKGLMYWHWITRKYPNITIAAKAEDIPATKKARKTSLILASQCGDFIDYELHRIEAFYRLGLRMLILAYSLTNKLCAGCLDRTDNGLTAFGRLVVDECNRVGLLLDCSHIGRISSLEIIDRSSHPVVFSHSSTKAIADNPRNIDDTQIKACAAKGGVIGLSPWGPMTLKTGQIKRPTVDDFIDHIDHVAQILGSTDNIGVGTDMSLGTYADHVYDPWGSPEYKDVTSTYDKQITANIRSPHRMVEGFAYYPEVLNFAAKLRKRGYNEADVQKILGQNYMRVFKTVWK